MGDARKLAALTNKADRVVAARKRSRQAEPGQVEAEDAPPRAELGDPAIPGVEACGGAVEQHERHGIIAPSLIAHMHRHAGHLDKDGGRRGPAVAQCRDGPIRRPGQSDSHKAATRIDATRTPKTRKSDFMVARRVTQLLGTGSYSAAAIPPLYSGSGRSLQAHERLI